MELRTFLKSHNEMKKTTTKFKKRDQFSSELLYFSDCIQNNREPEPDAIEGIADVKIIEAILTSIHTKSPVSLEPIKKINYPDQKQKFIRPGVRKRKVYQSQNANKSQAKN